MKNGTDGDLVLELPTDIHSIEGAVEYVMSRCSSCSDKARRKRLNLNFRVGLTEALSNAMLYGNADDPSKRVFVEVSMASGSLQATVKDQGSGFDPNSIPDPTRPENLTRPCGRGVFLMRQLLDEVWYNDRGNEVTLVLRLESGGALEGGVQALNTPDRLVLGALPEPVLETLQHFESAFGAVLRLIIPAGESGAADEVLYQTDRDAFELDGGPVSSLVVPHQGPELQLQVLHATGAPTEAVSEALTPALTQGFEATREIQFFTYELSERFEEINLLYSISETLGSTLDMDSGAGTILGEVRDVMGAKRGSLWVHEAFDDALHLAAEVGDDGRMGPLSPDDPDTITSMVFREGRPIIASRQPTSSERESGVTADSFLSVPIRYSPGSGGSRTVGVINLIGRQDGGRFSAANQKLLAAIASQIGAAIENHRLVQESLSKERMAKEMELAHDLQMKLLPDLELFPMAEAAGRVQPTEQVGGDFYQLFELPGDRVGVMLGDVSLHGFPSALIMTLTMSAAGIYAREAESPAGVLRKLDDALADELATTEMFLTVFYGVIDPAAGVLVYANAGHPHAFVLRDDGSSSRLTATDPPVGFAGEDSYSEESVAWNVGEDLLLLFTDGLPDTLPTRGLKNGEAQILETAAQNRFRSPREIIDELFELAPDAQRSILGDDRTALVLRR